MNNYIIYTLLVLSYLLIGCQTKETSREQAKVNANVIQLPYDLGNPDEKKTLKKKLNEISALEYIGNDKLATVQDEKGTIYILSNYGDAIIEEIKFAGKGDFEGLTRVEDRYFAVRSDGKIYDIQLREGEDPIVQKYETPLGTKNDVEGVCYRKNDNELLVLCKEEGGIGSESIKGKKAIYAFNLSNYQLSEKPKFLIDVKAVNERVGNHAKAHFKPSGMAINPFTNDLFIVTSVGKLLIVLGSNGDLKEVVKLSEKKFKQPEGVAFDDHGNLYISNEGREGKPNILLFNRKD